MGPEFPLNLVGFPIAALIAYLVWRKNARNVALRRVALAERTPVVQLSEGGPQKIVGRVRYMGLPLEAPLTGRLCACYDVSLDRNNSTRETRAVDFCVEDETGTVLVRSDGLQLLANRNRPGDFERSAVAPRLAAFLKRQGKRTWFISLSETRWREAVVQEGQRVAVLGTVFWALDRDAVGGASSSYRDRAKRVVICGTAKTPLIVSNEAATLD